MRLLPAPICRLYTPSYNFILTGCSVEVLIVDVHASVELSQRFSNPTGYTLNATYAFGLMAGAAMCGFEMVRKDGTRVEGRVRSKEEADKEFRQAKREGKTAALGREETHDVFSISVGNIQPFETVTINLRFIQALTDDENHDEVKFIFPRTYAQRYGVAPTVPSAARETETAIQPFDMKVAVQQAGLIKSISCPSGHPISFKIKSAEATSAEVTLKDTSGFLTQDVILVVSAANLDNPRCFIEAYPSSPKHNTTAMALTFVPRFEVPDVSQGMEYIFMIDRSGSMYGRNIQLVKDALVVLLRSLPTKDTTFNLVSFGSRATTLWRHSREYTQSTVDEATNHVDSLQADYGGTEIPTALRTVFTSLQKPLRKPVAVFLLTDGSSWDISACVSVITDALRDLPGPLPQSDDPNAQSFIRVFTLGIGAGASSDMCESIARAGEGVAVYAQEGEEMVGKCARLVSAARTPPISIEVEWMGVRESDETSEYQKEPDKIASVGHENDTSAEKDKDTEDDDDAKTLRNEPSSSSSSSPVNLFNPFITNLSRETGPSTKAKLNPKLPPPPTIQQAPLVVPTIFPGTRTCIYAIIKSGSASFLNLKHSDDPLPTYVKVWGTVKVTGRRVELKVPITRLLQPQPSQSSPSSTSSKLYSSLSSLLTSPPPLTKPKPFLHILAAKALITDRQEGKHAFPSSIAESNSFKLDAEVRRSYIKKDIIRLGTTYRLTSEHTSFIAVDDREHMVSVSQNYHARERSSTQNSARTSYQYLTGSFTDSYDPMTEDISSHPDEYPYIQEEYGTRGGSSHYNPNTGIMHPPSPQLGSDHSPVTSSSLPPTPASKNKLQGWFGKRQSVDGIRRPNMKAGASFFKRMSLSISMPSNTSDISNSETTSKTATPTFSPLVLRTVVAPSGQNSSTTTTPSTTVDTSLMSSGERLASIARLQRFDGGFAWSTTIFSVLQLSFNDLDNMKRQLSEQNITADIAATVLAWVWLERNGGYEATEMAKKAGEWVGIQLGTQENEELKNKVLAVIPLS
ncbi:uncharacterized protein C8R40DRAFT_1065513 [Lentinula edodes]|uniref:uncharacterized protein n=1 Tax=Lentinula edodes TaxID=5353 RepID=UPI001E8CDF4C|nr:uncharacterized protein C8R40DRAFT_1065513 [Lentinula edodes]KAH7880474.1 hypothetical protein C8R40DRAFT_1065513 [Lentinula edodes]